MGDKLIILAVGLLVGVAVGGNVASERCPVRTVVVSDSLLNETIEAQKDTIEMWKACFRSPARYPVCFH